MLSCTFSGLWSHWSRLCMYFSAYITHCRAVIIIFLIFLSYIFLRLYKHEKKKVGDAITCAFWCWLMLTRNLLIGQFNIVVKETTDRVLIASTFGKCSAVKRRKEKKKLSFEFWCVIRWKKEISQSCFDKIHFFFFFFLLILLICSELSKLLFPLLPVIFTCVSTVGLGFPLSQLSSLRHTLHTCSCLFIEAQLFKKQSHVWIAERSVQRLFQSSDVSIFVDLIFSFTFNGRRLLDFEYLFIFLYSLLLYLKDKRELIPNYCFHFLPRLMYTWWRSWTRFRSNGSRSYILPLPPGTTFIILFCLLYTARSDHRQFDFSRHTILLFYILTPPTTLTNNTCYMIITKQYLDMIGRHKKKMRKEGY